MLLHYTVFMTESTICHINQSCNTGCVITSHIYLHKAGKFIDIVQQAGALALAGWIVLLLMDVLNGDLRLLF